MSRGNVTGLALQSWVCIYNKTDIKVNEVGKIGNTVCIILTDTPINTTHSYVELLDKFLGVSDSKLSSPFPKYTH
jgi:hypothetical protein